MSKYKKEILITNTTVGLKSLNKNILKLMLKEIKSVFKKKLDKQE